MTRAFLCVLDSVGCGGAIDASDFGDEGANTLGHIAQECASGRADLGRSGPLNIPNLAALGAGQALLFASGIECPELMGSNPKFWAAADETSLGKDTPSGHWELACLPVPFEWTFFPNTRPAFSEEILAAAARSAGSKGTLCNRHSDGSAALDEFGEEHLKTGNPICYTSADSVFQIAAHETYFGLDRLYTMCEKMAAILHPKKVGRVIARPFLGEDKRSFSRTENRKDFAITPPNKTMLDIAFEAGRDVYSIGKIYDIFSGRGITKKFKGADDMVLFDHLVDLAKDANDGALIFANFVEFDSLYGHRRDVAGYARALEKFDNRLPEFLQHIREGDLVIFTADHGNDPTWKGTDHTRERVPVLGYTIDGALQYSGRCDFSDVGKTILDHLKLENNLNGISLL